MDLPGNVKHRKILEALVNLFRGEKNIKAFGAFGSLTRGDWDDYSDLDLDAIVDNDSTEKVATYLYKMIEVLNHVSLPSLIYFEEKRNEWVLILETLDRISIRFHTLENTSPNILDSFVIYTGKVTKDYLLDIALKTIKKGENFELLQNKFLEHAIYVPIYIHRQELFNAFNMLNVLRNTLITIYYKSHGLSKIEKFEKNATSELKENLLQTFSTLDKDEIRNAFRSIVQLYIVSINTISYGKLQLNKKQIDLLNKALKY